MSKKIIIPLLIVILLIISFLMPNGIRASVANNLWSLKFLHAFYQASTIDEQTLPSEERPYHPGFIGTSRPTTNPHASVLLAREALRQDQPEKANELILPLLNYSDRAVLGTHAEILYKNGNYPQAIAIWESLNDTIILERAAGAAQQTAPEIALSAYQALYRLDPEKYTSSLAVTLKNMDRLVEAADLLQTSRKTYPNSQYASDWLRYLADIYTRQKNWSGAEQLYLDTINEDPNNQKAWRNLGLLYLSQLNLPEKAIECFQKMVELSPNEPSGYTQLARAYENSGNLEGALQTYQNLLKLTPEDPTVLQAIDRLTTQIQPTP